MILWASALGTVGQVGVVSKLGVNSSTSSNPFSSTRKKHVMISDKNSNQAAAHPLGLSAVTGSPRLAPRTPTSCESKAALTLCSEGREAGVDFCRLGGCFPSHPTISHLAVLGTLKLSTLCRHDV